MMFLIKISYDLENSIVILLLSIRIPTSTPIPRTIYRKKKMRKIFSIILKFCLILSQQQTLNSKNKDNNDEQKNKDDITIPKHDISPLVLRDISSNNKQ